MGSRKGRRIPLPAAEKQRRINLKLCFYCGEGSHIRATCPDFLPPAPRAGKQPPQVPLNPNNHPNTRRQQYILEGAGDGLSYDDSTVDLHQPSTHHTELEHITIEPKMLRKQPLRGQLITGLFRPGGPAMLVHGAQMALAKLELATTRDGLTLMQHPPVSAPSEIVGAFMWSVAHLQKKGEFPASFLPVSLFQPVRAATQLQYVGNPPFKVLDISRAVDLLALATICQEAETGSKINYQLGVLTFEGCGKTLKLRAQIIPSPTEANREQSEAKTVWLYRRIVGSKGTDYNEEWRGFGARAEQRSDITLPPLRHPATQDLLEKDGDGYLMMLSRNSGMDEDVEGRW